MPIIRHQQLSKMTDKRLEQELSYNLTQFNLRQSQIKNHGVMLSAGVILVWPTRKLIEDLALITDYLEAIVEEFNYRYTP